MQILLLLVSFFNAGWPEERSGTVEHPVMGFSQAPNDTNLTCEVQHYLLELNLDIPAESLWARAEITLRALEGQDSIKLDFVGLEIADVIERDTSRDYVREDSSLVVALGRTTALNEIITLSITYHGEPTLASGGFGRGLYINPGPGEVTYTCNAPWGAKYWFPCQDNPADKATVEMIASVPPGYDVIANGALVSADTSGDPWTFTWEESHPIATYLVALAASTNYAVTEDMLLVGGDIMPILHWVMVEDSAEVTPKLRRVDDMIEYFSELFYPYPFSDEKYAQVHTPVSGAMENQNTTHINTGINWGDWDYIIAHELSHSWWGNSTTCRLLKHMWLNEGFATYCEALWAEERDGAQAYQTYYEDAIAAVYLSAFGVHDEVILDPPWSQIYSALTYEKPAAVLHMLRRLTGDTYFFQILVTYGERYKYSTAVSEDFEAVVNEVTGEDYSWFFDQWLREPAHPSYQYGWYGVPEADSFRIVIEVSQVQNWPPDVAVFRMPVEFGLTGGADTSFVTFTDSLAEQTFELYKPTLPDEVVFDPHSSILCKVEKIDLGVAESSAVRPPELACRPVSGGLLDYSVNTDSKIDAAMFDVAGRRVGYWMGLAPSGELDVTHLSSGVYFIKTLRPETPVRKVVLVD